MIASGRSSSRHRTQQPRPGAREKKNSTLPATENSAASRYDVLERSGEGTLFVVYRVRDKQSHSICALKALKSVYSRHETFAAAIANAVRASSGLRHPHLAAPLEVGEEEDTTFLIEEWLPGGTLEKRLRRAPFGPIEITALAIPLLEALSALHENGIAHGDVRPRQILYDAEGQLKLNDIGFSMAYNASGMTMTDVQLDAAYYQSPERWDGHTTSPRADLYTLGVVLYRAATGRVPFDGTSPLAIAMRHRNDAPLRPQQFNPHCTPELEALILRLLEKEPSARFASAREALRVLAPEHQPTPARRIPAQTSRHKQNPAEESGVAATATIGSTLASTSAASTPAPVAVVAAAPVSTPEAPRAPQKDAAKKTPPPSKLRPTPPKKEAAPNAAPPSDPLDPAKMKADRKRRGRREMLGAFLAFFWTLVAACLLVGICYGAYAFWMKEAPPEVRVPKYVGLNQTDAKRLLGDNGLQMRIGKEVYNPKKPEGTILGGDPAPGKMVRRGRPIQVTVSRGEAPVRMVDFSDLTIEQARVIINRHGMRLGQIAEQYHERIPRGFVCGQFPEPGESFRRSEPINLVVSRGPLPPSVAPAPSALPVAPLPPRLPDEDINSEPPAEPSTPAPASEEILISRGAMVTVALPANGGPQEVKIVVRDSEGEYTAYQKTHEAGDVIDKPIQVVRPQGATALVRVYIGGRLLREIRV